MTFSLSFFSLISQLLQQSNDGLHQALQLSKDQQAQFTISKIDMDLKCLVINDGDVKVIPSNAQELNYYGKKQQSTLKLTFKLTPTNHKKGE